jgi:hypothetical protein
MVRSLWVSGAGKLLSKLRGFVDDLTEVVVDAAFIDRVVAGYEGLG